MTDDLLVEYVPTAALIPYARNSRTHSDDQVAQVAASIREFGFTNPVLISEHDDIIAGHGRVKAAAKLGLESVPCIRLGHLTDTQRKAYVIADNRLALNAGWDLSLLTLELKDLQSDDFDLHLLGFEATELDGLLNPEVAPEEGLTDPDDVPENVETRCKPGDLWQLGNHRLLCGDSTDVLAVERLMGGEKADMVYTDPPYGIGYSGKGITAGVKGNDFGEIRGDDSITTAVDAYRLCKALDVPVMVFWGANFYCSALDDRCSWIVWDKQVVGEFYSACELAWTNRQGRIKQFVHKWHGMVKGSEHGQARVHPTQKPIALAEWCMAEYDGVTTVLDLFLGSGSTLIACEKTSRRCFGMEIDPKYCDVVLKRWEQFTGKTAERLDG